MIEVQVRCPYCEYMHSPNYFYIDDEFNELRCAKCNKVFIAEAELNITTKKYNNDKEE